MAGPLVACGYPNYDELLTAAVKATVNEPDARRFATWRWGRCMRWTSSIHSGAISRY